jgi:hypothetical protein
MEVQFPVVVSIHGGVCGHWSLPTFLRQLVQFLLVQMLYDFTNILRVLPRCNQQGIRRIDYHQIAHPYDGNKLVRRMYVIALRVQDKYARAINNISFNRFTLPSLMLVERGPGAEVVPAKIRGEAENVPCLFALR